MLVDYSQRQGLLCSLIKKNHLPFCSTFRGYPKQTLRPIHEGEKGQTNAQCKEN